MAWDAPSGWRGCSGSPHTGRRAQAEGLRACPLWAPQPARVPFLNINEQAQECLPHSWPRQAREGGAGREETARPGRPSQAHLPCSRPQQAELGTWGRAGPPREGQTLLKAQSKVRSVPSHAFKAQTLSRIMHCHFCDSPTFPLWEEAELGFDPGLQTYDICTLLPKGRGKLRI